MDKLWVDEYRPKTLDKLTFHSEITEVLEQMAKTDDFPVLFFLILAYDFLWSRRSRQKDQSLRLFRKGFRVERVQASKRIKNIKT
jgi:hypothetical protein